MRSRQVVVGVIKGSASVSLESASFSLSEVACTRQRNAYIHSHTHIYARTRIHKHTCMQHASKTPRQVERRGRARCELIRSSVELSSCSTWNVTILNSDLISLLHFTIFVYSSRDERQNGECPKSSISTFRGINHNTMYNLAEKVLKD